MTRDPTPEMIEAAVRAHCERSGWDRPSITPRLAETYATIWRAMFDAAPTQDKTERKAA